MTPAASAGGDAVHIKPVGSQRREGYTPGSGMTKTSPMMRLRQDDRLFWPSKYGFLHLFIAALAHYFLPDKLPRMTADAPSTILISWVDDIDEGVGAE